MAELCSSRLIPIADLKPHKRNYRKHPHDLCLQVLSAGWCTVLLNAFLIDKATTGTMKGGNATELYQGDGRLAMARSLERMWPGVVTTKRRYGRPQHVVNWRKFDTPLKLKPGIDISTMTPNEYGMRLVQVKPEVKSAALRDMLAREAAVRLDEP